MKRAARRFSLLTLAFSLGACSGEDEPARVGVPPIHRIAGCEAIDHASCDVREAPCQERLLELTACIRDEETPPMPLITVMTETEFSDYLYSTVDEEEPEPEVNHLERALVRLGMAEPNALTLDVVISELVKDIGGVYRSDEGDVIIVDHGEASDPDTTSSVLVHEFVHYLQDRQFDLSAFSDSFSSTSDASLASDSVLEGEAEVHQVRHYAALLGLDPNRVDYRERFEAMVGWSEQYLLEQPSPFTKVRGVFPYSWGGRYMQLAWDTGGRDAVAERFASPPTQTRTLMLDVNAEAPEDVDAVAFPSPETPAGWSLYSEDVGGAFLLFLYLATLTTPDEARALSLAWRGDTLSIFAREEGTPDTVFVWRFAFADAVSRDRILLLAGGSPIARAPEGDAGVVLSASYYGEVVSWALTPLPE